MLRSRKGSAGVAGRVAMLAAAGTLAFGTGTAQATPSSGVSAVVLAQWTVGGTDFVLRQITVQPGGTTGWHWHNGVLFGRVKSGALTHQMSSCTVDHVYRTGEPIVEEPGPDKVHRGLNREPVPLVLDVLYVLPHGAPPSQDAADPGCPSPA